MYITYCREQRPSDYEDRTIQRLSAKGGSFRPTWVIRVSDWKRIRGTQAKNGYHTLSYCWEQSGEVVRKVQNYNDHEEYDLVDNGKHCIIEYAQEKQPNKFSQIFRRHRSRPSSTEKELVQRKVTYDQLVQQMCKDFGIKYIWYDKICIDQSSKKAKQVELKQMHRIYGNACYTLALIPEVHIHDPKDFDQDKIAPNHGHTAYEKVLIDMKGSHWWDRSWTLEEVMTSQNILIVGKDTHIWQQSLHRNPLVPTPVDILSSTLLGFSGPGAGSLNAALNQAHFRTSTKPHDMIFALANIFPHLFFDHIELDYEINFQTTLYRFYRHLILNDLSILCFGSNLITDRCNGGGVVRRKNTMLNYNLPTWTGVDGAHIVSNIHNIIHKLIHPPHFIKNENISDMKIRITTNHYWKIPITRYKYSCFSPPFQDPAEDQRFADLIYRCISSVVSFDLTSDTITTNEDTTLMYWYVNMFSTTGCFPTHYHHRRHSGGPFSRMRPLSLTEDCDECFILPILFDALMAEPKQQPDQCNATALPTLMRTIDRYTHMYYLPVFRELLPNQTITTNGLTRYKAIGLYMLGAVQENNHMTIATWNHSIGQDDVPSQDPNEILDILFKNDYFEDAKEFIIE
ncbi:hypothetical protein BDA99DRAFT_505334 [Phascolomyces articulosus]|uniref:Heterokaryon incompatibility domain-containing protein n=1 Tax=Phascolomyces articulosus TaxID=60185 RepID=A0AAD5PG45_9FUNG|nr:hypothetical protein BDA99DRAFT_505334 [Phascolomyces articulosus]